MGIDICGNVSELVGAHRGDRLQDHQAASSVSARNKRWNLDSGLAERRHRKSGETVHGVAWHGPDKADDSVVIKPVGHISRVAVMIVYKSSSSRGVHREEVFNLHDPTPPRSPLF